MSRPRTRNTDIAMVRPPSGHQRGATEETVICAPFHATAEQQADTKRAAERVARRQGWSDEELAKVLDQMDVAS